MRREIAALRAKICECINTSGLPWAVSELVVLDVYNEVRELARREEIMIEKKKGEADGINS